MEIVRSMAFAVKLAARSLNRTPRTTALIVLTLAVGIAANMVTSSFLSALLIRPYPFEALERIVIVRERRGDSPLRQVTPADFLDIRRESVGFMGWAAYGYEDKSLTGGDGFPARVRTFSMTPGLFSLVGAEPELGRAFTGDDDRSVILSDELWRRRFGADPAILGAEVALDGLAFTVVGVMPRRLNFPLGAEAWVPIRFNADERSDRMRSSLFLLGRLEQDFSLQTARTELARLGARLAERYPETNRGRTYDMLPLRRLQYVYTVPFFSLLQLSAVLVLFLACANGTGLLFAYRAERARHIAVLGAVGAGRGDLLALSVVEAMLLGGTAWLASVPLAHYAIEILRNAMPAEIATYAAGWYGLRLDATSGLITAAMTLAASLGVGLAARYRWDPSRVAGWLRGGRMGDRAGPSRGLIVSLELALGTLLLCGSVFMGRGFERLIDRFEALEPEGVLTFGLSLPRVHYPEERQIRSFNERLLHRLETIPGVRSVGALTNLPASNVPNPSVPFHIEGRSVPSASELPSADLQTLAGRALELFHVPVVLGQSLGPADDQEAPLVAVVSETMAERHWPHENPIGRHIRLGSTDDPPIRIVGVVGDVRQNWFDPEPRATIYVPAAQRSRARLRWVLRSSLPPTELIERVQERLHRIDPKLALAEPQSLEAAITESIAPLRIIGMMIHAFAAVAAALALTGIYAVTSANVASRTKELGTRIAFGARRSDILFLVVWRLAGRVLLGLAVGIFGTWILTGFLAEHFFGLIERDGILTTSIAGLGAVFALLATLAPAIRAANLDPIESLREG